MPAGSLGIPPAAQLNLANAATHEKDPASLIGSAAALRFDVSDNTTTQSWTYVALPTRASGIRSSWVRRDESAGVAVSRKIQELRL